MTRKTWLKTTGATLGLLAMMANATAPGAAELGGAALSAVAHTPSTVSGGAPSQAELIAAIRAKVKYVFVIYAENRSFDHYFGTFPGANGLFSAPEGFTPGNKTASFIQKGSTPGNPISPFLIPQAVPATGGGLTQLYPADTASVNHSHTGMLASLDYPTNAIGAVSLNDNYFLENGGATKNGYVAISHIDCDTIPFLWSWAKNFAMFDNLHQTIIGPSSPNAIALISGQSGVTQWSLHHTVSATVPVVTDAGPFPGSNLDPSNPKPPYGPNDVPASSPNINLTFASQPLSFMGGDIATTIAKDPNPLKDLIDVQHDIFTIATSDPVVNWGWYEQGFNLNDTGGFAGYVTHHNGPQYFGYLADNPAVLAGNLHGAQDFFTAVQGKTLPADGGVFYLRGGYNNNDGLVPASGLMGFIGNDDHPGYSDAQISEALDAEAINAIAASPYWSQSAIIITYDETDGLYDHVSPSVRILDPTGAPLTGGPRIPAIVISPYANTGLISHRYSEHGSVIKFINELFGLVPLASLPDEKHARALGNSQLGQPDLEPSDDPANGIGDLTEAFDYAKLTGASPPVPTSAATFTEAQIKTLPQLAGTSSANGYTNGACAAIGMLPTDFSSQAAYNAGAPIDPAPASFNPRQ